MTSHDLIIATDAHLTDIVPDSEVSLEGFRLVRVHRSRSAVRADYRGVALYVREPLADYISVLRKDNTLTGCEVLWTRLSLASGSLLLGACYLAPETSRVYTAGGGTHTQRAAAAETALAKIQQGIRELREPGEDVLLAGDLNARLSSPHHLKHPSTPADLPAYICDVPEPDQFLALQQFLDVSGEVNPQDYSGIRGRRSEDLVCNFAGQQLGAMCRSLGLLLLNGRVVSDLQGRLTFPKGETGGSMIDLFVSSPHLLKHTVWLRVGELLTVCRWLGANRSPPHYTCPGCPGQGGGW